MKTLIIAASLVLLGGTTSVNAQAATENSTTAAIFEQKAIAPALATKTVTNIESRELREKLTSVVNAKLDQRIEANFQLRMEQLQIN